MGRKLGAWPPFEEGGLVPVENLVPWAEDYLHTKWHHDAFSRLATTEISRKLGRGLRPLFGEWGLGPHLT